ncbi:MAG: hypothetical protein ACI9UV_000812 [Algoriphagus sp.]|jgi:hypothetical protein
MNETQIPTKTKDFTLAFEVRYARVLVSPAKRIIICELLADYIPMDDFKVIFNQIGDIVKAGYYEKFIFDKRSLRAFHQPTMEWYFIHWKKDMLEYGVTKHRKILPLEKWFEKMVQIAKLQIFQNYPDNIIDKLDIQYCDSIEEAIAK